MASAPSTHSLLLVNAATLAVALGLDWPAATLMFLPYARILPMHFTIILGGALAGERPAVVLIFGALKTAADVLMHHVEHRILQRGAAPAPR